VADTWQTDDVEVISMRKQKARVNQAAFVVGNELLSSDSFADVSGVLLDDVCFIEAFLQGSSFPISM
jgi:hypothetical protein